MKRETKEQYLKEGKTISGAREGGGRPRLGDTVVQLRLKSETKEGIKNKYGSVSKGIQILFEKDCASDGSQLLGFDIDYWTK